MTPVVEPGVDWVSTSQLLSMSLSLHHHSKLTQKLRLAWEKCTCTVKRIRNR